MTIFNPNQPYGLSYGTGNGIAYTQGGLYFDGEGNQVLTGSGDFSANAATIPMSGFVLLITVPASPTRQYIEVQNQSASPIQLVRQIGSVTSSIILASGGGAGLQGGGWTSSTFLGEVLVYGPTGSQVAAYQD